VNAADRELLERAAKAAGAEYEWDEDHIELITPISGGSGYWSPLTDDGDALRLAVAIRYFPQMANLGQCWEIDDLDISEPIGADSAAAARRAIVRAAAEMAPP
jgi:hypothetical protein